MKRLIRFTVFIFAMICTQFQSFGQCDAAIEINSIWATESCWGPGFNIELWDYSSALFSDGYGSLFLVIGPDGTVIAKETYPLFENVGELWDYESYCLQGVSFLNSEGANIEVGETLDALTNNAGVSIEDGACIVLSECVTADWVEPGFVDFYVTEEAACIDSSFFEISLEIVSVSQDIEVYIQNSVFDTFFIYYGDPWPLTLTLPAEGEDYYMDGFNVSTGCGGGTTIEIPNCGNNCDAAIELNSFETIEACGGAAIMMNGDYTSNTDAFNDLFLLIAPDGTIADTNDTLYFENIGEPSTYMSYCVVGVNYLFAEGINIEIGETIEELTNFAGESIADGACMVLSECVAPIGGISTSLGVQLVSEPVCIDESTFTVSFEFLTLVEGSAVSLTISSSMPESDPYVEGFMGGEVITWDFSSEYSYYLQVYNYETCYVSELTINPPDCSSLCDAVSVMNENAILAWEHCATGEVSLFPNDVSQVTTNYYVLVDSDGLIVATNDVAYFNNFSADINENTYDDYCIAALDVIEGPFDFWGTDIIGQTVAEVINQAGVCIGATDCVSASELIAPEVAIEFIDGPTCINDDFFEVSISATKNTNLSMHVIVSNGVYNEDFFQFSTPFVIDLTLPMDGGDYLIEAIPFQSGCSSEYVISIPNCEGPTCEFTNPLTDLAWVEENGFLGSEGFLSFTEYEYEGETVFFVAPCEEGPDGLSTLFDCQGNELCYFGGIAGSDGEDCPGFPETATLIQAWQDCDDPDPCNISVVVEPPVCIDADFFSITLAVVALNPPPYTIVILGGSSQDGLDTSFTYSGNPSPIVLALQTLPPGSEYVIEAFEINGDCNSGSYFVQPPDCSEGNVDCNGVLGGNAIIDVCGNCLDPNDANFNSCVSTINETICADSILQYSIDLAGMNVQEPMIWLEPDNGTVSLNSENCWPCIDFVDFAYNPDTEFVGIDTVGIAWFDATDPTQYFIYYYVFEMASCNKVWPGDVNNDGISNNLDLVHLGLEYNNTGPQRPNATSNWEGQTMTDWESQQIIGINSKFADCDGNGVMDLEDRDVILLNYNEEHALGKTEASGAPLYLDIPSFITAGESLEIPIVLGTEDEMIEDFYGMAFAIEFDTTYVVDGSVTVDFNSPFLGIADEDVMGLSYTNYNSGRIEIGVSKIDEMEVSGNGIIGTMSIVMIDDIIGKAEASIPFKLLVKNITALKRDGTLLEVGSTEANSEIQSPDGLTLNLYEQNRIYPNPANDVLFIESKESLQKISLIDVSGKILFEERNPNENNHQLDLGPFRNGMYFVKIQSSGGENITKINIVR